MQSLVRKKLVEVHSIGFPAYFLQYFKSSCRLLSEAPGLAGKMKEGHHLHNIFLYYAFIIYKSNMADALPRNRVLPNTTSRSEETQTKSFLGMRSPSSTIERLND
ncbi:hypothetical protein TNCV_4411571 [Trichonephila clavipes]|nr:hypothetical protein TNCV_4411571 [Trichonephila clavipes]